MRGGDTLTLNPPLSPEESATRGCTVQQPGGDRLCWEFTVSERAVRQTDTRLHSSDSVSASSCWGWRPRGVRWGTAGGRGAAACLNPFWGFYESILNWEKIYCNALMNRYFYPPLTFTNVYIGSVNVNVSNGIYSLCSCEIINISFHTDWHKQVVCRSPMFYYLLISVLL